MEHLLHKKSCSFELPTGRLHGKVTFHTVRKAKKRLHKRMNTLHWEPGSRACTLYYLILLTSSLKSPPSTHFSSPPPPTPKPPPAPPPPTPHPSPTSPMTRAGCPPTTDPDAMTIFVGTTVFGRILTFSFTIANGWMITFAPMCTCEDIEMADIVLFGPGIPSAQGHRTEQPKQAHTNEHIIPNLHGIVMHLASAYPRRRLDDASCRYDSAPADHDAG